MQFLTAIFIDIIYKFDELPLEFMSEEVGLDFFALV